jgi:antitoxin component of MazEF toxin-antitoxin module
MVKHLTKHGNSLALVIDKPVLELLGIDAETPLTVTTDGSSLIICRAQDPERRKAFDQALAEGNKRYGKMLKRLAE